MDAHETDFDFPPLPVDFNVFDIQKPAMPDDFTSSYFMDGEEIMNMISINDVPREANPCTDQDAKDFFDGVFNEKSTEIEACNIPKKKAPAKKKKKSIGLSFYKTYHQVQRENRKRAKNLSGSRISSETSMVNTHQKKINIKKERKDGFLGPRRALRSTAVFIAESLSTIIDLCAESDEEYDESQENQDDNHEGDEHVLVPNTPPANSSSISAHVSRPPTPDADIDKPSQDIVSKRQVTDAASALLAINHCMF